MFYSRMYQIIRTAAGRICVRTKPASNSGCLPGVTPNCCGEQTTGSLADYSHRSLLCFTTTTAAAVHTAVIIHVVLLYAVLVMLLFGLSLSVCLRVGAEQNTKLAGFRISSPESRNTTTKEARGPKCSGYAVCRNADCCVPQRLYCCTFLPSTARVLCRYTINSTAHRVTLHPNSTAVLTPGPCV